MCSSMIRFMDSCKESRHFGLPVANTLLVDEARRVARELDIVKFNDGWLTNWKRCFNMGIRQKT